MVKLLNLIKWVHVINVLSVLGCFHIFFLLSALFEHKH